MNESTIERALVRRAASARELSPTPAQVSAAVRAARRERRRSAGSLRRGSRAPALGLAALLVAGTGALAATNVLDTDLGSFLGGGNPPGRPLTAAETPGWIKQAEGASGQAHAAVVASAGSRRLIAYRDAAGNVCFDYAGSAAECGPPADLVKQLAKQPFVLRGPIRDHPGTADTHGSLFGFVRGGIAAVRLDYPDGHSLRAPAANGTFAVPIALGDHPTQLVGLTADGKQTASLDLARLVADELAAIRVTQP